MATADLSPEELEETRRKKREAQARWRAKKSAGDPSEDPKPADPTVRMIDQVDAESRGLIAEYLNARSARLLKASQAAYEADLAAFALEFGRDGLLTVTHSQIGAWIGSNARDPKDPDDTRPWSRRTAKRKLSAIQGFYRWAVREDRIKGNPADGIEIARDERSVPERMSYQHVMAMDDYIEDRIVRTDDERREIFVLLSLIFRLMYNQGMRVSEAATLRVSKIRLEENEETGRMELRAYPVKKGDKVKPYPLTGKVLEAYDRWVRQRADLRVEIPREHRDFLCVHPWHGRRLSRKRVWQWIRRIAYEAGVPREIRQIMSPHKLRHAIAYHMLDEGYTIAEVQSFLDHSSITSTQVYVAADERARMQTIRKTNQRLSDPVRAPQFPKRDT